MKITHWISLADCVAGTSSNASASRSFMPLAKTKIEGRQGPGSMYDAEENERWHREYYANAHRAPHYPPFHERSLRDMGWAFVGFVCGLLVMVAITNR